MSRLTFEQIRRECEPMKHLLVDEYGDERLYLGFNRYGSLITDTFNGEMCDFYHEYEIKNWTIKEYKPTRKVNAWDWLGKPDNDMAIDSFLHALHVIKTQHSDLEIEVTNE